MARKSMNFNGLLKKLHSGCFFGIALLSLSLGSTAHAKFCPPLLNHSLPRLQDESAQNLCQYAGKVVLIVNTASKCGFTGQYEGLERLYDRYREAGLVVIGFPSGDFGGQELASNKEIAAFCANTFNVRFPMLVKTSVRGDKANPVFAGLIRESGTAPKWNFYKYLLGRDGRLVKVYSSMTEPDDRSFVQDIERSLRQSP
ncbi:MAG: glutathione peroxidase [Betaproteobacteria bacterium]|nr:glutathione peroxidase [Betaproteobacteria bacterium]